MATANSYLKNFTKIGQKILGAGLTYGGFLKSINAPIPKSPFIFLKAPSAYLTEGNNIEIYKDSVIHEEVELGVVIGKKGRNISESDATNYIGGYCLGIDLTDMKIINEAKANRLPWTLGKSFDGACPVSRFISPDEMEDPGNVRLWLKVNGKMYQDSTTADLVFSISNIISYISNYITLEPGDMILTGTPPGVDQVVPGDIIEAGVGDILSMKFPVVARS